MKTYKQLTFAQRYEIALLRKQGKSQQSISDAVGVSKSSISRELARNSASGKYEAEEAQRRCVYKKSRRKAYKLTDAIKADIVIGLKADLSPEQIVGQASLAQKEKEQKEQKEQKEHDLCWFTCLRSKQRKRRRRKNQNENRSILHEKEKKEAKISIELRPDIITNKGRIGDCEIDTIIGKDHKGAILTLVERVTKHTSIVKLPNKSSDAVTEALGGLIDRLPFKITSITADNGTEFADYANIKQLLNCDVFFAHPYCSWERGLNENTNGLIRQYIPKKTDFDLYDEQYIRLIETKLNDRPRKTLHFNSPLQFLKSKNDLITCCT